LGWPHTWVPPLGQQASAVMPVRELEHVLGDSPRRHRPPTVKVHELFAAFESSASVAFESSASATLATDEAERIRKARRDLLWKIIVVL